MSVTVQRGLVKVKGFYPLTTQGSNDKAAPSSEIFGHFRLAKSLQSRNLTEGSLRVNYHSVNYLSITILDLCTIFDLLGAQ